MSFEWCPDLSVEAGWVRVRASVGCPSYDATNPVVVAAVNKHRLWLMQQEGAEWTVAPVLNFLRGLGSDVAQENRDLAELMITLIDGTVGADGEISGVLVTIESDHEELAQMIVGATGVVVGTANPVPAWQIASAGNGLVTAIADGERNVGNLACVAMAAAAAQDAGRSQQELDRLRLLNWDAVLVREVAQQVVTWHCTGREIISHVNNNGQGRSAGPPSDSDSMTEPETRLVAALVVPMEMPPPGPVTLDTCSEAAMLTAADLSSIVEFAGNKRWIEANLSSITHDADRNWVVPAAAISWVKLSQERTIVGSLIAQVVTDGNSGPYLWDDDHYYWEGPDVVSVTLAPCAPEPPTTTAPTTTQPPPTTTVPPGHE